MCSNLIQVLQKRGLIAQITDEKILRDILEHKKIVVYCGFDPTADSLHLGHLIPLLCLKRFQDAGHQPIILLGGATGLIGDPSFKENERKLNSNHTVHLWVKKIFKQVIRFLDFNIEKNPAIIVNNYDWFKKMSVLTFLRDIGKNFSINQMINRDAVKKRLCRDDQGITFTEFSYNLLQSYDFSELNKKYGVLLQIGGSDQWGNIISGIDLTRRLNQQQVFGLTLPLMIKADGKKFGKTENQTIWLDPKKTSPYTFFQFWINTSDEDVYRFLKLFTFMDIEEIKKLEQNSGQVLQAKYILAEEITRLVHGEQALNSAKRITNNLFFNIPQEMQECDFEQLSQDGLPTIFLKKEDDLQHALVLSGLASSLTQARIMIRSEAVTINGEKKCNIKYKFTEQDKLFHRFTLLRRGKKNYCMIEWL